MVTNIEKLLRMVGDYHNFCENHQEKGTVADKDALSLEELDLVAAASGIPMNMPEEERKEKKCI